MQQTEPVGRCPRPKCGEPIYSSHECSWCIVCGEALPAEITTKLPRLQAVVEEARRLDAAAASPRTSGDLVIPFGFIGGVIGLFVGYLMRPAVPLVGQLDFGTVISRGLKPCRARPAVDLRGGGIV